MSKKRFTNEEMQELNGLMQLAKEQDAAQAKAKYLGELIVAKYNERMKSLLEEKGLDSTKKYSIGEDNEFTEIEEKKPEEKKTK